MGHIALRRVRLEGKMYVNTLIHHVPLLVGCADMSPKNRQLNNVSALFDGKDVLAAHLLLNTYFINSFWRPLCEKR